MANKDLLDAIDENFSTVNRTPLRQLGIGRLSSSRNSSDRKSRKLCKLYTPNKTCDVNEDYENYLEPCTKKMRLSSISHNATIGNGSQIDTSFDVVDVTPGIDTQKTTFLSYLNSYTTLPEKNVRVTPKSMQKQPPLSDSANTPKSMQKQPSLSDSANTPKSVQNQQLLSDSANRNKVQDLSPTLAIARSHLDGIKLLSRRDKKSLGWRENKLPGVSGIKSLQTASSPLPSNSKYVTPVHSLGGSPSIRGRSIATPVGTPKTTKVNGIDSVSKVTLQTPNRTEHVTVGLLKSLQYNEEESELPATQPTSTLLLKDVIAYVEVRSGGDNRSMGVKAHLRSLGATVRDKFTNDVTHVVFNEGLWSTYKKAIKKKVHLVSVLWIEECKNAQNIVSERLYPPFDMEQYECPSLLRKHRKIRSLQPDLEDSGEQKIKMRRPKKLISNLKENDPDIELPESFVYKRKIKVPGFLENVSKENDLVRALLSVADIGPEYEEIVNRASSPTLSEEEDFSIPLAVRLLRKILTPQSSPELTSSSRGEDAETSKKTTIVNDMTNYVGISNIPETPKNECVKSIQNRNEDLLCHFANDRDVLKNTNTDDNDQRSDTDDTVSNSSSVPFTSPTFGRFDTVSLTDSHKLPAENIMLCSKDSKTQNNITSANSGSTAYILQHDTVDKGTSKEEFQVQRGTKRKRSMLKYVKKPNDNPSKELENSTSIKQVDKVNQFLNDKSNMITENKGFSIKKRKLLPLPHSKSPEVLDVSTVTEEANLSALQCPYTSKNEGTLRRKRKAVLPAGETSVMELTPCASSTTICVAQHNNKRVRKKFDFASNQEHEVVSKVKFSTRRSSEEFIKTDPPGVQKEDKQPNVSEKRLSSLVCTGLLRHEVEVVAAVVNKLGGFVMEANVSERTTHIVTQGPRRTVNLLKGIARGCWVVLQEWVLRSLDAGSWIEEDGHELMDFSPAVQQCRVQKLSFGPVFKLDLFHSCGNIYVTKGSAPPKQDLEELIKLCGGHVVASIRSACLLVGKISSARHEHVKHVNEKWVLDSIQFGTLKSPCDYVV